MKHIYKGILNILTHREKKKMSWLILFDLLVSVLDIVFLGGMLVVINFYTSNSTSTKLSFLPDAFSNHNSLLPLSSFLILFFLKNYLGFLISKIQHHTFYEISSRLSKRNIRHYLKDDYLHFVNVDSSVFNYNISHQPIQFSQYILINVQQIISQTALILFAIIGIILYYPDLFFLLFLLLLPPIAAWQYFLRNKLRSTRAGIKLTSHKTIQHLQEALSGYVESNIFNKTDFFVNRYYWHQRRLNENIATQQTLQGLTSRFIEVFAILGFFILIAINKLSTHTPAVSMLTIGVFITAAYKIIPGIVKILNSSSQIKTYSFIINDLQPVNIDHTADEKPGNSAHISSLMFYNIKFKFENKLVLKDINFELFPGDIVGISAPSGKGKTTMINLLLGFLKQDSGHIYINGKEASLADRENYRSRISYVKQQSFLINDTILKNIILSDEGYDHAKLSEVILFCGMGQMIAQLPDGLNELIAENGKNISGGQRQRIMLARALYHDFDVLILDEAFSEMDDASEKDIMLKLKGLVLADKMILLITHNISTLSYCDRVISLENAYA